MKILKYCSIIVLAFYLLNPTAGILEIIPDNIPWIGNIDEVLVVGIIIKLIKSLKKE